MNLDRIYTAALIVIGDEILSGRTQDRNVAALAGWLGVQGIRLSEVRIVPDVQERIVKAVNALRTTHDYLFTTGGIGRRMTTSPSTRSPRRSACPSWFIPTRARFSRPITPRAAVSPRRGCVWRACRKARL